jgi:hypothetical protein
MRREQLVTNPGLLGHSVQECPTRKITRGRGPASISQYSCLTLKLRSIRLRPCWTAILSILKLV